MPNRKRLIAEWKDRKAAPGVYAIRCIPTGAEWIGQAADLSTVQARHWFGLRFGSHTNREMQRSWAEHGEAAFVFEPLELLPDEEDGIVRAGQLRDAMQRWRIERSAKAA